MKSKSIIIALIIINIILIGIVYNNISENLGIISKQVIKEMSESTQVTDLNKQINALNAQHTEYLNYIQTCKAQIATALTNQKVTTSEDATLETMAENIEKILEARTSDATATEDNISEGKTAWVNGKLIVGNGSDNRNYMYQNISSMGYIKIVYLGEGNSFDVTNYNTYQNFNVDSFIVEPIGNISSERQWKVGTSDARAAGKFTFAKSYVDVILTIDSVVYADNIDGNTNKDLGSSPKKNITYKCYLIIK